MTGRLWYPASGNAGLHLQLKRFQIVMTSEQPGNPLHGVTLAMMLEQLVAHYGWDELGFRINIRCFTHDPSIKSSLAFLRKTPWARKKVENLYLDSRDDFVPVKPA